MVSMTFLLANDMCLHCIAAAFAADVWDMLAQCWLNNCRLAVGAA